MKRKLTLTIFLVALAAWLGVAVYGYFQTDVASTTLTKVVVGYQKADPVDISRQRGELAKKMKAKGYQVVFKEFQDGAALMTALKSGSIDYARLGDTPPVVNQAAGMDLVYVGAGASKENGTGVLVKQDGGIQQLADLKGKRIAYAKGTAAQFMIIQALKQAGLSTSDVTLVNMDQSAASVAFARARSTLGSPGIRIPPPRRNSKTRSCWLRLRVWPRIATLWCRRASTPRLIRL